MKYFLMLLMALPVSEGFAQFPSFLKGTWKRTDKNSYEQWSSTGNSQLKGVGFRMTGGLPEVVEYTDIVSENSGIFLVATVPGQNQGKSIRFQLRQEGNRYIFENPKHDFPQQIIYEYLQADSLKVSLSATKQAGLSYLLQRMPPSGTGGANPQYDAALAQRLGADDYGMKSYWLVILKTGLTPPTDKKLVVDSFRGHMENMEKLVQEGKLVVAGPLGKNDKTYRGIFILKGSGTLEETQQLVQTDPAVQAGLLAAEIYPWYGSAALPEYLPAADKVWKLKP